MILSPWRKTARSSISSVNSGASSGSTQGLRLVEAPDEFFCLFSMAIPHRDDVTAVASLGPSHDHCVIAQPPDSNLANLAIIRLLCDKGRCLTSEHLLRIRREINPAFSQGDEPLGGVEGDVQIKCTYIIRWRQRLCNDDNRRSRSMDARAKLAHDALRAAVVSLRQAATGRAVAASPPARQSAASAPRFPRAPAGP